MKAQSWTEKNVRGRSVEFKDTHVTLETNIGTFLIAETNDGLMVQSTSGTLLVELQSRIGQAPGPV